MKITGYYYREKYNTNEISFSYDGKEYITDGIRLSEFTDRYKTTVKPILEFDTGQICDNLEFYHKM